MQKSRNKNSPYDILFTPLAIGPVTVKNRFYQVPHCNGGGHRDPSAVAAMRGVKAEGGWGVVFTEQVDIHPSSEITPYIELRLWDDADIPMLAKIADAIHEHDALAGIELVYAGINAPNLYSREVPLAVSPGPILSFTAEPVNARGLSKNKIAELRGWFAAAASRAKSAGFDIVCLYGAHGFGIIQHFLSRATNHRTDEYGGSLQNRSRFMREVVEEVRDATGNTLGLSLRLSLHESQAHGFTNDELRACIAMHAELPDVWDLAHGTWEECSATSRFTEEGAQEQLIHGIKQLTPKPVVGVGRFTSPEAMVRQVKAGLVDFIGAARPSIADPFLPVKIREQRTEDIRECIGCNICVAGDMTMSISRCTQNPAFMEEWRKGWHPENIAPAPASVGASASVLVVGGGAAGLEAARALGQRGYEVTLAEASDALGGRVAKERQLPGLAAWGRVADYRVGQIQQMSNVTTYLDSTLSAEQVLEWGAVQVCVATGAWWRRDGVGRAHLHPLAICPVMPLFTPDDIMNGNLPSGRVIVYDDDHYYLGGVLTELLVQQGCEVALVTPATCVSQWTRNTLEQTAIQKHLLGMGVRVYTAMKIARIATDHVHLACIYSEREQKVEADGVLVVTSRLGNDELWHSLRARRGEWREAGIRDVQIIGDAAAPAPIAWAVYAGHRYARELDESHRDAALPFRRELPRLTDG